MKEIFDIAGYCRISVDEEQDRDNTSIENQKAIITDYVKKYFPGSSLEFFEDRDRSGYTFEQRESYQVMRRELMSRKKDILIVKDFSRFSRRNSRGLVELEDLRDADRRIISIGDNIDFPNDDDWLKIQFQFLINEMPVTDTSRKVKSVIKRRQADAKWICNAPYGYIVTPAKTFELVPEEADVIRQVFEKYIDGWGYKKIANFLTDENIPTPRMSEKMRKEAQGLTSNRAVKKEWSIITVQGIIDNDFYIGTFRQHKYTRAKINGKDKTLDESEHIVFENHHQPVITYRTFRTAKALRSQRTRSNYRGTKMHENVYTGLLTCGDCGAPMFSMSRADLREAYRCGTYHRRGLKGCTSHHTRVENLNEIVKTYIKMVKENSSKMIEKINQNLDHERETLDNSDNVLENLHELLDSLSEELKVTKRQRVRDIIKKPEQEETLSEIYDELEEEISNKIDGIHNQITLSSNRKNTIIRVNRVAKSALEIFDDIINKEKLTKADLDFIIENIKVYEDKLEIYLKADIDAILTSSDICEKELAVNFNTGIINSLNTTFIQSYELRKDKVYDVNVICNGDPLEIFTNRNGEVIFKKYSPLGEISTFITELCETISKVTNFSCVIADKDHIIATTNSTKTDLNEQSVSNLLERIMEERSVYQYKRGETVLSLLADNDKFSVKLLVPIITDGDITGAVILTSDRPELECDDSDIKVSQSCALFLAKHIGN